MCGWFLFLSVASLLRLRLQLLLLLLLAPRSSAFCSQQHPRHSRRNHRNNFNSVRHRAVRNSNSNDAWSIITLGDLHMEDDMAFHEQAREDCLLAVREVAFAAAAAARPAPLLPADDELRALERRPAGDLTIDELQTLLRSRLRQRGDGQDGDGSAARDDAATATANAHLVCLGDLGRGNKDSRHGPGDAGTSECFQQAKRYLDGYDIPYDLVTGNHDLEALDEFATDADNLRAWMDCFGRSTPHFHRYLGSQTLLLGLSTVRFRDAPYSSHEVYIDDAQIEWFRHMVESHAAQDGWTILVFSHAPILGSGLRVLQTSTS